MLSLLLRSYHNHVFSQFTANTTDPVFSEDFSQHFPYIQCLNTNYKLFFSSIILHLLGQNFSLQGRCVRQMVVYGTIFIGCPFGCNVGFVY